MGDVSARGTIRIWARLPLLAALALILAYWTVVVYHSVGMVPPRGSDFAFYELAAIALRFDPHANIYSAQTLASAVQAHGGCFPFQHAPYTYPPLLAILLEPLAGASCGAATTVWDLVNVALWLLATALLIDSLRRRWPERQLLATVLVAAASLTSWHMLWGFWLGQVHIVTLCGVALALWLYERQRQALAGAALVFVTLIELHPAVLLAYFALRGRWRVLAGAGIMGALLVAFMVVMVGPGLVLASVTTAAGRVHTLSGSVLNESVTAQWSVVWAALLGGLWVAGVLLARGRGDDRLGYAWAICAMLVVSPLVWSFYLVWLLPAVVICLGAHSPAAWRVVPLLALYGVTAFPLSFALRPVATALLWLIAGTMFARTALPETRRARLSQLGVMEPVREPAPVAAQ